MGETVTQPEETIEEQPKAGLLDKLKIHKFKILGGILGVLVFAGAVFGAYKFGQKQIPVGLQPTPTPMPSEVSTEEGDETADWEIYRDPDLKYEFRYPPDPLEPSRSEGDTSFVVGYPIKEEYRNDPFIAKSADKTFWITLGYISQAQLNVMGVTYCGAYPNNTSRCESIKIGGVNSTIDWGREEPDAQTEASVWIRHPNSGVVTFSLQPVVPESKEVFYQMLSTFKFLEESDETQIRKVLDGYIPAHSLVKVFELEGLKILGNFAKVTAVPKDVVTDKAMVILEKSGGEWSVIWGPGTAIGKTDPVLEKIPEGLLE